MNYFDIHSHLYFPDYDTDREEVIANLKKERIWTCTIGTDLESSKKSVALAEQHENIIASVGVHPEHRSQESGDGSQEWKTEIEKLAEHPKVKAIGECGFDVYRTSEEEKKKVLDMQRPIFESQVDLAIRTDKALMIHARPTKGTMDAYEETLVVLEPLAKTYGAKLFGDVHFFVGDLEILRRFLDIGFSVSFTGVLTFARDYDEAVRFAPLSMIHVETDAPFVAPVSHRGSRNSPEYIAEIVEAIAKIRHEDVSTVQVALLDNARKLFRLD